MLTSEQAREISQIVFQASVPLKTELIFTSTENHLTRVGANRVTQNLIKKKNQLSLRLVEGQKSARIEINQWEKKDLLDGVEEAKKILALTPPDDQVLPLLEERQNYAPIPSLGEEKSFSPEEKAEKISRAIEIAKKENLHLGGMMSSAFRANCYANSQGIFAYHPQQLNRVSFTFTGIDEETEGWAQDFNQNPAKVNVESVIHRALEKAKEGKSARDFSPGTYPVILESAPTADLIAYLSGLGSSALSYHENRAYHSKKLGEKFFSEKLSVRDDAFCPSTAGVPFDHEGMARQKVQLIENGSAVGLVWDRPTAKNFGGTSTGHSLAQPNAYGPRAENLIMKGGTTSIEDMIGSLDKGFLVSKLHYIRVQDPKKMVLTGMTRAGLFWIEKGRIAYPVKTMRFTVSLLDVFRTIEEMGASVPVRYSAWGTVIVAPPIKIPAFHFSSASTN